MKAHWQAEKDIDRRDPRAQRSSSSCCAATSSKAEREGNLGGLRDPVRPHPRAREEVEATPRGRAGSPTVRCSRRRSTRRTSPRSWPSGPASPSRCWRARWPSSCGMEEVLHERVVGQDEAVSAVSNAVRRSRAGLRTPTGRSARSCSSAPPAWARPSWPAALAEFLFDDEKAMVRIDMSEYMEKHSVSAPHRRASRLRGLRGGRPAHRGGAPPPVRGVLFDEIEKAHPDVFNVLLQVLDDGRSPTARAARSTSRTPCSS
jgi:ATP-dependent Clp protease ATP-binding subunit ClpB